MEGLTGAVGDNPGHARRVVGAMGPTAVVAAPVERGPGQVCVVTARAAVAVARVEEVAGRVG